MKELNHSTDRWFGRKRKKKKNTFIRKKEKKIREREETQRVPEREHIRTTESSRKKREFYTLWPNARLVFHKRTK